MSNPFDPLPADVEKLWAEFLSPEVMRAVQNSPSSNDTDITPYYDFDEASRVTWEDDPSLESNLDSVFGASCLDLPQEDLEAL